MDDPSACRSAPVRVLVADSCADVRSDARTALEGKGLIVEEACDGPSGIERVAARRPDIVMIDVGLPVLGGIDLMTRLRQRYDALPVILLAARSTAEDRAVGLELGADDFVAKPFLGRELAARTLSVLRRARRWQRGVETITAGPLVIVPAERKLLRHGQPVEAPRREFDLLAFLASSSPGRVYTREELLREVWGSSAEWQDPSTVTEHVRRLRKRIEADPDRPKLLQTVRGVGYRFDPQEPLTA